jgi:hypothetical protein
VGLQDSAKNPPPPRFIQARRVAHDLPSYLKAIRWPVGAPTAIHLFSPLALRWSGFFCARITQLNPDPLHSSTQEFS